MSNMLRPKINRTMRNLYPGLTDEQIDKLNQEMLPRLLPHYLPKPPPPPEQPRDIPLAFGYLRASHIKSTESGLGLKAQAKTVKQYYKMLKVKLKGKVRWGGWYVDKTVSAFKRRFMARPAGGMLHQELKPGDHILCAKHDRAFRNIVDFRQTNDLWASRDITLHLVNIQVDMSTAMGKMFVGMAMLMAEWESAMKSERIKEVIDIQRKAGRRYSYKPPRGKKMIKNGKNQWMFVDDWDYIKTAKRIYHLHADKRMTCVKISDLLEMEQAEAEKREPHPRGKLRTWSHWKCLLAIHFYAKRYAAAIAAGIEKAEGDPELAVQIEEEEIEAMMDLEDGD